MQKRGEVTDILVFVIILFFLAVSFIACGYVLNKLKDVVETTPLNETVVGRQVVSTYDTITFSTIPNAYIFIMAFLIIGQIVTSFLVRYHPVFIVLFIIFAGFGVFVSFVLANAYELFVNANGINAIAEQIPKINWVWQNIGIIMCSVSALSLIILFARLPNKEGGI